MSWKLKLFNRIKWSLTFSLVGSVNKAREGVGTMFLQIQWIPFSSYLIASQIKIDLFKILIFYHPISYVNAHQSWELLQRFQFSCKFMFNISVDIHYKYWVWESCQTYKWRVNNKIDKQKEFSIKCYQCNVKKSLLLGINFFKHC